MTVSSCDTVDVRADVSSDFKGLATHEMELIVVKGKGLGQLRRMSAQRNLGGNPAAVRFTVCPPWDVPPGTNSVVSAGSWHVNNVFYHNIARGSKSPYNMYYGGCYDCVDAEAVSRDTEGWNNWGRIGEFPERWRLALPGPFQPAQAEHLHGGGAEIRDHGYYAACGK